MSCSWCSMYKPTPGSPPPDPSAQPLAGTESGHPHVESMATGDAMQTHCVPLSPITTTVTPILPGAIVTTVPEGWRAVVVAIEGDEAQLLIDTRDVPLPKCSLEHCTPLKTMPLRKIMPTVIHPGGELRAGNSPQKIEHPAIKSYFGDYDAEHGRYLPLSAKEIADAKIPVNEN